MKLSEFAKRQQKPVVKEVKADRTDDPSFKNTQTFGRIPTPTIKSIVPKAVVTAPVIPSPSEVSRDKGNQTLKQFVQQENAKIASIENKKVKDTNKEIRSTATDRTKMLERQIKDKYGIDVEKRGKPFQVAQAMKEAGLTDEQKKRLAKDLMEYETTKVESSSLKQAETSFVKGFSPVLTTDMETKYLDDDTNYKEALQTPVSKVANVTGNLAKFAALYGIGGAAVAGQVIPTAGGVGAATGSLNTTLMQQFAYGAGSGTAGVVGGELIKDLTIGAGIGTSEALQQGQRGDELAKTVAQNILMDIGFNVGGAVIGKTFRSIKEASDAAKMSKTAQMVDDLAEKANISPEEASKAIDAQIDFYVNQSGVANTKPFEQLQLSAPKSGLDDFTKWRKENFGGAFGKLSEADDIAMKQLYKEETGIDLLPRQIERPKVITQSDLPKKTIEPVLNPIEPPIKPTTDIKTDVKQPKPQKEIPTQSTIDDLNAKYNQEVETIKSNVFNKTILPAEGNKQLKEIGQKHAAEVKKLEKAMAKGTTIPKIEPTLKPKFEPETPMTGTSNAKFTETAYKSEQTTAPLRERIKDVQLGTTTTKARIDAAKKLVDESPDEALTLILSGEKFTSDMEGAIGNVLYGKLQTQGRYDDALEVMNALGRKARKSGQEIQILSAWTKTTPEGMARWAIKTLEEGKVAVDSKLIAEVSENMRSIQEATPEQLAEMIKKQSKKDSKFIDKFMKGEDAEYLKELNTALTMKRITDKLPIASARQLSTIQAMSHLLNGRTFSRNILGNMTNATLEQFQKPLASGIDAIVGMKTGRRTIVNKMPKWKQSMGEAMKEGKRSANEILLGVNRVNVDKYDVFFESAFKDTGLGNIGKKLEKGLSLSLATPDEFFKGFVKADSLYNQVRARVGKEVDDWDFGKILDNATPEEVKLSVEEAKFATFQEDSLPAKMLTDAKKLLNQIGYGKKSYNGIREFGLGDLVIKYTRVPGNIIARSIDYSPIGYLKLFKLAGDIADNPQAQRQFSQVFARATSGTGLAAMGYALTKLGVVIDEKDSKNYDKLTLNRSEGLGGLKINMSGLGRLITGGDPKLKEGDNLASFDWLPVISPSLSVGSTLANSDESEKGVEDVLAAFANGTVEQMTDLPTMYILKSMMNEATYNEDASTFDILSMPIKEALPGFVPSLVRQFAQFVDPVVRDTKGKDSAETARKKIMANIPFLSKKLEPKINPLGDVQTRETGLFKSFVLPANTTTYKPSGLMPSLEKIEKLTGETSMYPDRKPPKSFDFKLNGTKEKIELTDKEKTVYQQTFGKELERRYQEILRNKQIETDREAQNIYKKLQEAESKARTKAKEEIAKGRR